MNIETLLSDTFTDREHLAPTEDEILPAVRRRTRGRSLARPLAIAASVVVVAGAAYGVVTLTDGSGTGDNGAPQVQPGTHHVVSPPHAVRHPAPPVDRKAPSRHRASQADAIAPLTMPFDLGWLPDGSRQYVVERVQPVGGHSDTVLAGEYMIDVTAPDGTVYLVDVQQWPYGPDSAGFKSGTGADVTINGQHAVESANSGGPGGYEAYFHDPQGGDMYVNVMHDDSSTGEADLLARWGRHVANSVELPGTAQVTPDFGVGGVPAGMKVLDFDVDDVTGTGLPLPTGEPGHTTSYGIGSPSQYAEPPVSVSTAVGPPHDATPGRDVQGHATRVSDQYGYRRLYVLDAVDGHPVAISGAPMSQMYQIADGLVLPGE